MSKPTDEAISEWDNIWKKRFAAYRCPLCKGKAVAVREAKG